MDVAAEAAVAPAGIFDLVRIESNGDGPGFLGMVFQVPGDDSCYPPLPAGTLRILPVDGTLKIVKARDATVVDRCYLAHGEVVVSLASDQIGIVTGVDTVVDLVKLGDREPVPAVVMSGVSPDNLRRVRELSLGDFVVSGCGSWLGRVVEVSLNFNVLFDDGAVCRVIRDAQRKKLQPVVNPGACYVTYVSRTNTWIYPGQRVKGPAEVFKGCRWLNGHWQPSCTVGTVSKVEMAGVLVHWIASAHCGTNKQLIHASAPPAYQHPDNLTFFRPAFNCYWGIGDRCFLRHKGRYDADNDHQSWVDAVDSNHKQDQSSSSSTEARKSRKLLFHLGQRRTRREQRRHLEFEQPMSVASTSTTVDVLWQDGTRHSGVPSTSLKHFKITSVHEIFPEFYVVDKAATGAAAAAVVDKVIGQTRRVGVVRSVSFEDQTVAVSWFKQASCPDEGKEDATVSAYDLAVLPDHYVYYGDVVVRPLLSGGRSTVVQALAECRKMRAPAATDLSWVGSVVDLRDGRVLVKWGDGSTSTVLPHEISVVHEQYHSELHNEMGIDSDDDDGFNELQDEDSEDEDDEGTDSSDEDDDDSVDDDDTDSADEDRIDPMHEDGAAATRGSGLGAIFQSVLGLASQVLAQAMRYLPNRSSTSLSSELDAVSANVGPPAVVTDGTNDDTNNNGDAIHATAAAAISDDDGSAEKGGNTADASGFPHFDVTQSPLDHHYIDNLDQGSNGGKKWVKAVQKEWKILKNNLPDTIYIRAFEDRMDLLRAAMVGASGTPYQDGLFFFDLHLPPTYPAVPPLVYYHSFGLSLNPNLYDSGTVCLSLLNTFGGEGTEVWLPETSTLLQVVVSIQGLILNNQPFFNEAGYDALIDRPEGRRNAVPYNENACLLTLQSMLHLLRRPPQGFEEFVRDHFRRRGTFVLRACEAYLRGCIVGTLDGDARATEASKEDEHPCSAGLRLALAKVVPRLVTAFAQIDAEGCDCDQFPGLRDMLVGADGPPCAL